MKYARVAAREDGESYFDDVELEMSLGMVVAGVPPMSLSAPVALTAAIFVEAPEGATDWKHHVAPRRQFVFVIAGRLACETSDGDRREFGPGDIVLAEDTVGRGHLTIPLTPEVRLVMLPLAE